MCFLLIHIVGTSAHCFLKKKNVWNNNMKREKNIDWTIEKHCFNRKCLLIELEARKKKLKSSFSLNEKFNWCMYILYILFEFLSFLFIFLHVYSIDKIHEFSFYLPMKNWFKLLAYSIHCFDIISVVLFRTKFWRRWVYMTFEYVCCCRSIQIEHLYFVNFLKLKNIGQNIHIEHRLLIKWRQQKNKFDEFWIFQVNDSHYILQIHWKCQFPFIYLFFCERKQKK